jgi:hypothetical protein
VLEARAGGVGDVATSVATIAERVSRLRREQRWAAANPSVAKRPVPAARLGKRSRRPQSAGGDQSVDDAR